MRIYGHIQSYALVPNMKLYQPPSLMAKTEKQENKHKSFSFNMVKVIVIEKNLPPTHPPWTWQEFLQQIFPD